MHQDQVDRTPAIGGDDGGHAGEGRAVAHEAG